MMPKEASVSKPDKSVITNGFPAANSLDSRPAATSRFKASNANGVVRLTVMRDCWGIALLDGIPASTIPACSSCSAQALSSDSSAAPPAIEPCSQYSGGISSETRAAADDPSKRKQPLAVETTAP